MKLAAAIFVLSFVTSSAFANIKTQTVEYKVGDTTCRGYLAYDDSTDVKRPGVIVVHEWWGLTDYAKRRAEQLAQLGYVAFCADMFGDGRTTTDPKKALEFVTELGKHPDVAAARSQAAMDELKKQPQLDPSRVAAIGYCFGGSTALNMARAGMDLKGVVSFHGSLATDSPAKKGQIKAKLLICHGAADPMVPAEQVQNFEKEMTDAGVDWQLNAYSHAVHAFSNPDADKFGIEGVGYNAEADRRSWKAMQAFFDEVFGAAR
ncbi:dienelactone hydrolase family protein [soil metagenome]